jgi:cyanophycin synthetase
VFADALTRSWKQVTKFRSSNAATQQVTAQVVERPVEEEISQLSHVDDIESAGFVRDERGVRFSKEAED